MSIPNDIDPFAPTQVIGSADGGWEATRVSHEATQFMGREAAPDALRDIGQATGDNRRELFVSCEPGLALQQQFEHLLPEFIAVHEIQTQLAAKLLAGVASASGRAVQTMSIRRQGYGNTLATLRFVELPTTAGSSLRLYASDAEDTDSATRHSIARTLLAHSRLGVVLVGDLPGHALAAAFEPLKTSMVAGPWPNRNLLLLPLSAAGALATLGTELSRSTGVDVRTTPTVSRPADAWTFISGTWTRIRSPAPVARPSAAPPPSDFMRSAAVVAPRTQPLPLRPMPETGASRPVPRDPLTRYTHKLLEVTGMVSACVFEVSSGRAIAYSGASPGGNALAEHGSDLVAAMLDASRGMGLGHSQPDAAITLGNHHLILRPVPKHAGLAMHAVLDKTHANITLARLQINRLDSLFDEPWKD